MPALNWQLTAATSTPVAGSSSTLCGRAQLLGSVLRMVRLRRHAQRLARASWRPLGCRVGARWAVCPSEGLGAVRGGSMRHVHATESASVRCSRYPICEAIEDRRARYYGPAVNTCLLN